MQKHMERFLEAQVYISIKFIIIAFRFKDEFFYISITALSDKLKYIMALVCSNSNSFVLQGSMCIV